jgi:hypothetical protein
MRLTEFAHKELELAGLLSEKDDFYGGMTGKAVMELIEVFSKQGHSGMSAGLVADIFWKLSNYKSLSPITGEDWEWKDAEISDDTLQNKRCFSLFKVKDTITYGNAIVFVDPEGPSWTGSAYLLDSGKKVRSSQKIKGFPFEPKSFRIDVEKKEFSDGELQSVIKHPEQLEEVAKYYDVDF